MQVFSKIVLSYRQINLFLLKFNAALQLFQKPTTTQIIPNFLATIPEVRNLTVSDQVNPFQLLNLGIEVSSTHSD